MAKVFVVTVTSWNGENDVTSVFAVYANKADAEKFCEGANQNTTYSSHYEVDEQTVL